MKKSMASLATLLLAAGAAFSLMACGGGAAPTRTDDQLDFTHECNGGSAGFTLTVNGTNLTNRATVLWNGAGRTTTFVSKRTE